MSFTFQTGIPAAGNNPSTDQPNMQTNNASTAGIIAVDHISFNALGGGQHQQVTFNANNVPSVPTSPPVLFTNTVSGLPQLFFYSGDAAHSSTQYSNSTAGSTMLLGGIIMKWGFLGSVGDGTTVTYPVAFPNAVYSVQITPVRNNTTPIALFVTSGSAGTTSFNIRSSVGSVSFYYLAIGV